jgi:serine/threonine protein kinase
MGACTRDPNRLMLVTELMHSDVEKVLRDEQCKSLLTIYRRMLIAHDCALGLAWLHGSDPIFIHRDVKPSNFLVDENFRAKITDFGLSQIRKRGESLIDRGGAVGTPLYMAPEVMDGAPFTEKSDVYSFGLVLWCLITGLAPFNELEAASNDSFADAVCSGHRVSAVLRVRVWLCACLTRRGPHNSRLYRPSARRRCDS